MAPRWIETKDRYPAMFRPGETSENNLILMSGGMEIGSVRPAAGKQLGQFDWSLYGPHTPSAPMVKRGTVATLDDAKAALLACWRAWQEWADMQDRQ